MENSEYDLTNEPGPQAAWRRALRAWDYHVGATIRWRWVQRALAPLLSQGALRVLDAGSGNGDYAFRLASEYRNMTIHGVDVDEEHVAACQARLAATPLPNLTFAQADLTEPLGTALYDLVYNVDVMEHILDDRVALANLARALRPGGWLVIHTPLTPQRHWLRRFDLDRCPRADHVRQGYQEDDLRAKVQDAGLEITSVRYTHGRWGTLAWELWMLVRPNLLARVLLRPVAMLLISLEMAGSSDPANPASPAKSAGRSSEYTAANDGGMSTGRNSGSAGRSTSWRNCILLQARRSPGES